MTHSFFFFFFSFSFETTVPLDGTLGKVEKLLCKAVATQVFYQNIVKEKIANVSSNEKTFIFIILFAV